MPSARHAHHDNQAFRADERGRPPPYNLSGGLDPAYPPPGGYAPNYPPSTYPPPGGDAPTYPPPGGHAANNQMSANAHAPTSLQTEEDPWQGSSFNEKSIRLAFIRKVYLILVAQLVVTFGLVCLCIYVIPIRDWIRTHSWIVYPAYVIFFVTYFTLACCPGFRRKWPANFICLVVFTLAFSYVAATVSAFYNTQSVLIAMAVTAGVCLSISIFSCQTKWDFTKCGGVLFAGSVALLIIGVLVVVYYYTIGFNRVLHLVFGALAGLLFSMFLAYDTQMLMGGRKYSLSPEEYIFGALQIYLDIVMIFLVILACFGCSN